MNSPRTFPTRPDLVDAEVAGTSSETLRLVRAFVRINDDDSRAEIIRAAEATADQDEAKRRH